MQIAYKRLGLTLFFAVIACCWVSASMADQIFFTKPSRDGKEMVPLYQGYPEYVHVAGVFYSVNQTEIVVDDTAYPLNDDTLFVRKNQHRSDSSGFTAGNYVGLVFGKKSGKIDFSTLESVWWLYDKEPQAE